MGSLQKKIKKNGDITYRVAIRKKGFPEFSQTFSDEKEAQQWMEITEKSMHIKSDNSHLMMKDMFDRYELEYLGKKSKNQSNSEKKHILFWRENINNKFIKDVSSQEIEMIADSLYKKISRATGISLTPESRRKYLMTLSFIYNIACIEWKWIEYNPIYGVDKHVSKIKNKKEKTIKISITDIHKKSFLEGIENEMKKLNIKSISELSRFCNMPKTTIQNLMDPKNMNVTLWSMADLAQALGKRIKFIYEPLTDLKAIQ